MKFLVEDFDSMLRVDLFNNALRLAKKINKPVVYGYTSNKRPGKFFNIIPEVLEDENEFRAEYNPEVIYVAYPDKEFIHE